MANLKMIRLDDVELRWAFLDAPQTKGEFASNKYQVDVVMNEATANKVKALKNARQSLKDLGDGLYSITLKSSKKPVVQDMKHILLTDEQRKSIGNGTKAYVQAVQYKGFKDAIFLGLNAVMIKDLKEFGGADPFADIAIEEDDDKSAPFDTDEDELV